MSALQRKRCSDCCTWNSASNTCCFKCGKVIKSYPNRWSTPKLMGTGNSNKSLRACVKPMSFEKMKCEKSTLTHKDNYLQSVMTVDSWDYSHGNNKQTKGKTFHSHNNGKLEGEPLTATGDKGRDRQYGEINIVDRWYDEGLGPVETVNYSSTDNFMHHSYRRKWPTSSSFYMWKKKSTLKGLAAPITSSNMNSKPSTPSLAAADDHEVGDIQDDLNELDGNGKPDTCYIESSDQQLMTSDNQTSFPLLLLPNELIFMILSNLHIRDLKTCRSVCKRLYNLVNDTVKGLGVMLTGNVTYHTLMHCCESLPSSVTFDKCLLDSKISVMDIVTVISMLGDHLKKLTIGTSNFKSIAGIDTVLHLFVTYCQNITFIKLEWITVSGTTFTNTIKKLKQLQALYLIDVNGISSRDWLSVLIFFHQQKLDCKLQSLCVKLQPELPLSMVLNKTYPIHSLKSIACRQRMTKVTKSGIISLLTGGPNIREVNIDCIEIAKEARDLLAKSSLKHNLRKCQTDN